MKEHFIDWKPQADALQMLTHAIRIIDEYAEEGYDLTLRQAYYRIIALDLFPEDRRYRWVESSRRWVKDLVNGTKNALPNYKWLGTILGNGRNAGFIDWDMIVDRGRTVDKNSHWESPSSIIRSAAQSFAIDKWVGQSYRVVVMVEKDALSGILRPVCEELDVEFSANKGYASQTHLYEIAKKMTSWSDKNITPVILYFGDHDPSGLDMDRDLVDRLSLYSNLSIDVNRLALTFDQIEEYSPPPNPAKMTDSRAKGYVSSYGNESWELDSMEPRILAGLVRENVLRYRDDKLWDVELERENEMRAELKALADNY